MMRIVGFNDRERKGTFQACYLRQWKGDCLTGALWIIAYKLLIIVAVKPPWCLSEE